MVAAQVMGNQTAVSVAGAGGQFEVGILIDHSGRTRRLIYFRLS